MERPRNPKGAPASTGGQFRAGARAEAAAALTDQPVAGPPPLPHPTLRPEVVHLGGIALIRHDPDSWHRVTPGRWVKATCTEYEERLADPNLEAWSGFTNMEPSDRGAPAIFTEWGKGDTPVCATFTGSEDGMTVGGPCTHAVFVPNDDPPQFWGGRRDHETATLPVTDLITTRAAMTEVLGSDRVSDTPDAPVLVRARQDDPTRWEIADGHHRVAEALRDGRTEVKVVFDTGFDDEPYEGDFYDFAEHMDHPRGSAGGRDLTRG